MKPKEKKNIQLIFPNNKVSKIINGNLQFEHEKKNQQQPLNACHFSYQFLINFEQQQNTTTATNRRDM